MAKKRLSKQQLQAKKLAKQAANQRLRDVEHQMAPANAKRYVEQQERRRVSRHSDLVKLRCFFHIEPSTFTLKQWKINNRVNHISDLPPVRV